MRMSEEDRLNYLRERAKNPAYIAYQATCKHMKTARKADKCEQRELLVYDAESIGTALTLHNTQTLGRRISLCSTGQSANA